MKKLFSLLLVFSLLATAFVLPVSAMRIDELYGDINKDKSVDTIDATLIQRHISKLDELVSLEYALADFNNDKEVTVLDATSIQQFCAKLIENPRDYEYLEFFVEIDDIIIKTSQGNEIVDNQSVEFTPVFDEVYDNNDAGRLKYVYTFRGITDESYEKTYETTSLRTVGWSFPSAGTYEVKFEVKRNYTPEVYSITKRFEVNEAYKFDGKRFVDYKSSSDRLWYDTMPKGTVDVAFDEVVSTSLMNINQNYGYCRVSNEFIALIKSKAEYDDLFEIDNTHFDDKFFETKSLVVAVTQGCDYYSVGPIVRLSKLDNKLYVDVDEYVDSPDQEIGLPVAPLVYSFVAVDKADVENIEYIERGEGRAVFVESYDYHDNCVYFRTYDSDYVPTLEKFSPYGVVEIRKFNSYQYLLMLDKHDIENLKSTVAALQDDEELCKFWFGPLRSSVNIERFV